MPQASLFIDEMLNSVCLKDTLKPEKMPLRTYLRIMEDPNFG
jgi:hypothetical protein